MTAATALAHRSAAPQRVEARVTALDGEGRGVVEIEGIAVRVEGALEGERVAIELRRGRRRFREAKLVAVLAPSPQRARPSCEFFHLCGGCRFQHLSLEAQRARKEHVVKQALSRRGVPPPRHWCPPITGPERGYRRKARLGVKFVPGKGGALVGFREKRGRFIADIRACEVLVPSVGERIHALRELVNGLGARARIPQIEVAAGDAAAALVFRHLDPLSAADRDALREFARRHRLRVYLQPGGPESVAPLCPERPAPLRYRIPEFDLELAFEPLDFVQVNAAVNRALVSRAVSWLEPKGGDRVLDLYCGIGNFSLALARRGLSVLGLESSTRMVAAARINAGNNGIGGARFEIADLEDPSQAAKALGGEFNGMLLDPPRSGAARVVEQLGPRYPSRIVYVSCNPESFARDAADLIQRHGYGLDSVGMVDMFPHTRHVEVIGLFIRGVAP